MAAVAEVADTPVVDAAAVAAVSDVAAGHPVVAMGASGFEAWVRDVVAEAAAAAVADLEHAQIAFGPSVAVAALPYHS